MSRCCTTKQCHRIEYLSFPPSAILRDILTRAFVSLSYRLNPHLLFYLPLSWTTHISRDMCGPAKDQEATVVDEPCGCCSSKVEACSTGVLDNSTLANNDNNDSNQDTKDSPDQVLPQITCGDSKNKDVQVCGDDQMDRGSPTSKDACKVGCCDDKKIMNEDDGCQDGCCSADDTSEEAKELEDGCCSSVIQQETVEDDATCKSACYGPNVDRPIEAGCGIEKDLKPTNVINLPSSSGCCSSQEKVNTVCSSTKNRSKSCTVPDKAAIEAPIPKTGCCSKVPLPNTDQTCYIPTSTNVKPSGCCPTIPQVIESLKKGCCGPQPVSTDTPWREGKTSGCCSTSSLTGNDDGPCDTKSPNDAGCCSSRKNEVGCGTKSCCTGDTPVKSEKGCCSKIPRKGKTGQVSKSKSSKPKSRAASLGASDLQLFISGKS
jgi:hypothetical protein